MIHSVTSTLPTFKSLTFHEGLNVLLADTRDESREGQTRNSAGKTTLIEVFHFLFGSRNDNESCFNDPQVIDHLFSMTFDLRDSPVSVSRVGANQNRIIVSNGSEQFPTPPAVDKESGRFVYSRNEYAKVLGEAFFGLPNVSRNQTLKHPPSFRSLICYLIRRDYDGGFTAAERNATKQTSGDAQINLSFALGLDWRIASEFQIVRDREKQLKELRSAARAGTLGALIDTVAALRAKLASASDKASKLRARLERFVVADAFNELVAEATGLKTSISTFLASNLADSTRLEQLRLMIGEEREPTEEDLSFLFRELASELPEYVKRRYDEVKAFHESVISNRKFGLQLEAAAVERRIIERNVLLQESDARRSAIITYLTGKGAFNDFLDLQRELTKQEAIVERLGLQFAAAQMLEGEKAALELERQSLLQRLQMDFMAHDKSLGMAIVWVDQLAHEFYDDREGQLLVEATQNGPEIRMQFEGDRGGGISKIEIFCFDIALIKMLGIAGGGPRLLVHDSALFDGVDERQIAKALEIGFREAKASGFQYIVTMNSDVWNNLRFKDPAAMNACVLPTRLDDRRVEGSLFGVAFKERRKLPLSEDILHDS